MKSFCGAGLFVCLAWCAAGTSYGAMDILHFSNKTQQARYTQLTEQLRCPKCQNQNLADSDAPIAQDLRTKIYQLLQSGQSDEQIIHYLTDRYGDFVRYNPPFNHKTALLWFGPFFVLLVGLVTLYRFMRSTKARPIG